MKNFSKKSIKMIKKRYDHLIKKFKCEKEGYCNFYDMDIGCCCPDHEKWYQCVYESESAEGIEEMERFIAITGGKRKKYRKRRMKINKKRKYERKKKNECRRK